MQNKIETMIGGIGELSLSAIATWFPSKSKEEIIHEIEKSETLIIKNDIVMDKNKKAAKEKSSSVNKKLNLAMQVKEITPKEALVNKSNGSDAQKDKNMTEITYTELIELIELYNKTVKNNYKKVIEKSFENISVAIIKYYEKRFNVIKHGFESKDGGTIYSLRHKKTELEVAYLYIGENLSKTSLDKISETFEYDTVYFCITKEAEVSPNLSTREFYLKDVEEITEEYLGRYKLEENKVALLKINEK